MLGAMAAPAIVRAESLMKIVVPKKELELTPEEMFVAMGWNYEPGQCAAHEWFQGPFGRRHDRAVFPSILMDFYKAPEGSRILVR